MWPTSRAKCFPDPQQQQVPSQSADPRLDGRRRRRNGYMRLDKRPHSLCHLKLALQYRGIRITWYFLLQRKESNSAISKTSNGKLTNGSATSTSSISNTISSKTKASDYYITPQEVRQRAAAAAAAAAQCAE